MISTVLPCLEAFLHQLKSGQEVEKFLELWIATSKNEIAIQNPETHHFLSASRMFLRITSRITKVLSYKLEQAGNEQLPRQIPLEH